MPNGFSSWHVGVAAEAFAAAQFARFGFDVSVQYGANQPDYDLMVARDSSIVKISVKGSKDGSWGLTQSLIGAGTADYHGSIERWLGRQKRNTLYCLVQFKGVAETNLPRMYLASPADIAARLHETASGRGDSILYEQKEWTKRATGAGTIDRIPDHWKFTELRAIELIKQLASSGD